MTLSKIIEQLKAADQNKSGMFELGEDVMCALVELLERRERDKQEVACYTDSRNLRGIQEKGRETALIWSKQNVEPGDIPLYAAPSAPQQEAT